MKQDIEIAQECKMRDIREIAAELGLGEDDIELYGKYKAKVVLETIEKFKDRPQAKYIDVTAITPTPLGEGKTTITVGLGMVLGVRAETGDLYVPSGYVTIQAAINAANDGDTIYVPAGTYIEAVYINKGIALVKVARL